MNESVQNTNEALPLLIVLNAAPDESGKSINTLSFSYRSLNWFYKILDGWIFPSSFSAPKIQTVLNGCILATSG